MAHKSPYSGPIPSRLFKEDLMDGVKELDMKHVKEMMRASATKRYRAGKNGVSGIHDFVKRLEFEYGMEKAIAIEDHGTMPIFDVTILSVMRDPLGAIMPIERRDHVLIHKER